MPAVLALRLCIAALVVSILCFAVHAASYWLHLAVPLPAQILRFLGVFGMTWPLWAYAVAVYRRHLSKPAA